MMLNHIVSTIFLVAVILYGIYHIPVLYRELVFYHKNNWDFNADSGSKFLLSEKMQQKFYSVPIGKLKIKMLFFTIAAPLYVMFIWGSSIYRHFNP